MKKIGNLILIVGISLIIVSSVLFFISEVNKNIATTSFVLALLIEGAGFGIKRKNKRN